MRRSPRWPADRGRTVLTTDPRAAIKWRLMASAALVFLSACGGSSPQVAAEPSPTPTDPRALYEGFIDCDPLPAAGPDAAPTAMAVPDGTVVTDVSEVGPLVQATGFVDATPVDLVEDYSGRDDVDLVYLEDEGFEAEILIDTAEGRTYIKATVRCRTGSRVIMLLSRDVEGAALPVPGQQAGTVPADGQD